jgi:hypothetical protein
MDWVASAIVRASREVRIERGENVGRTGLRDGSSGHHVRQRALRSRDFRLDIHSEPPFGRLGDAVDFSDLGHGELALLVVGTCP